MTSKVLTKLIVFYCEYFRPILKFFKQVVKVIFKMFIVPFFNALTKILDKFMEMGKRADQSKSPEQQYAGHDALGFSQDTDKQGSSNSVDDVLALTRCDT